jgi:hypothetical protein
MTANFQEQAGSLGPAMDSPETGQGEAEQAMAGVQDQLLGMAARHMAENGPIQPAHRLLKNQPTMTKAQLEQQKANEAAGLPSNLTEASRVTALESRLEKLTGLIEQIAGNVPSSPAPVPNPIRETQPPLASGGSSTESPIVTGMGAVPETPAKEDSLLDEGWDPEPDIDPFAEKVQLMCQQTREFLNGKDIHQRFRRAITTVGRAFGYDGWDQELKDGFNKEFKTIITDPIFLKRLVEKVLRMQMGHAVGPNKVAQLAVVTAGYTAFVVAGV